MTKTMLEIRGLKHSYGKREVLTHLEMTLAKGSIGCLLGHSASGKTTILRAIAGLEDIQSGEIRINGKLVSRPGMTVRSDLRGVGIVFQDYALFPHMTVYENILAGVEITDKKNARSIADKWVSIVGLNSVSRRYPHEISGGEQQRVALARAMALQPDLILLDEPFSNLDRNLRDRLSIEVRLILKESGTTALMVTHDQYEAFAVADEIGVLHDNGKIEQWGTPYDLYHEPKSRFIADFIGQGVFMPGKVSGSKYIVTELGKMPMPSVPIRPDQNVEVLLRPDDVVHDDHSPLKAKVIHKAFRGAYILYTLELASGQTLLSHVPSHHNHALGEWIGIRLDADHVICFSKS